MRPIRYTDMSDDKKLFHKAISNFTYDVAARGAIRHLHDLGYDSESIRKQLSYPVSLSQIEKEIEEYRNEKCEAENGTPQYEFIRETDAYGKTSFRRVKKDPSAG